MKRFLFISGLLLLVFSSVAALIVSSSIAPSSVVTASLADNAVTTSKIADNAVTTSKIVDNAVTSVKILDSAVTTTKILDDAVTSIKIPSSAITEVKLATNAVSSSKIKTATGSFSGSCDGSAHNVTMNDYNFFPAIVVDGTCSSTPLLRPMLNTGDPNNTVGRFNLTTTATGGTAVVRWRYFSATDEPRIWVISEKITGKINSVWVSDDPCLPSDIIPCINLDNMTLYNVNKFFSSDLPVINITAIQDLRAKEYITSHNFSLKHLRYRQLQQKVNNATPSQYIFTNMKINPITQKLEMK